MRNRFQVSLFLLCCFLAAGAECHAQAIPTASRIADLQIGGSFVIAEPGYSTLNADGTTPMFRGAGFYATFDPRYHFGAEVGFHQVSTSLSDQSYERTYEIGARYFRDYGKFVPYAKVMFGRGVYNYANNVANLAYNLIGPAAGVDFHATRRINVRLDYEYQMWLNFLPPGGMHPQLFSVGVAYHFPGELRVDKR